MLFRTDDFENLGFDTDFKSALPSADLLADSTLDGGLSTSFSGMVGASLQRHLVELSAVDALRAQQHVVRGLALSTGILSHAQPVVSQALNGFDVRGTTSQVELAEQLVTTAVGTAAGVLSAIPTPYTQIASAVLGLGLLLYDIFRPKKGEGPSHRVLPLQSYDDDTDAGHIHVHVNRALKDRDLTSLFLPRFSGSMTMQERRDEATGHYGMAFGLGDGQVGNGMFHPTGHLGFLPGGRRITSLIQTLVLRPRRSDTPHYDPRCGGCTWSGGASVVGRDVGSFYPSTNNAALTIWNHIMQVGPAMYEVDAVKLQSAWQDHADAWGDGLAWLWNRGAAKSHWGTGVWRCALQEASRLQTIGIDYEIGALSWAPFDLCDDLYPLAGFLDNSLYAGLADRASMSLWLAQHYYLRHTTVAAYLHPDAGSARNDPAMRSAIEDARRRILQGPERYEVRKRDVVDQEYKAQLRDAGAFTPSFERTFVLDQTRRKRKTPAGLPLSDEAPDPPIPPHPGGGSPLPKPPATPPRKKSRDSGLALAAGIGAAALLLT